MLLRRVMLLRGIEKHKDTCARVVNRVERPDARFPIAFHTYALGVEIERVIISRRLAPAGTSICMGLSGTSRLAIMHASCAKKLIVIANRFPLAFFRSSCRVRFPSPRNVAPFVPAEGRDLGELRGQRPRAIRLAKRLTPCHPASSHPAARLLLHKNAPYGAHCRRAQL